MPADTIVFRNAYVWVDTNDLSAQVKEAALNYASEMLDRTAMGDTTRNRRGGLYVWSLELTFHQSFTASVDGILFALVGTSAALEIRATNTCTTAANPRYTGIGCLESFPPLGGNVGTLLPAKAMFQSAGALTRSTTAT